jgi:GntR family transcriptional regulator, transcriptional repressor for pyruvate dehydrogenase complex
VATAQGEQGRSDRKADRVADDLLHRIVRGELDVGAVLPKEDELAVHYGVNRSVIREAIKLLEVHRLVRPVRRRGTEVLDPTASMSPEVLRAMISPGQGRVDREALSDFLEVRAALDVQMSTIAAERRSEEDLAALDRSIEALRLALHDRPRFGRAQLGLTRAIARATHNRIFEMLVFWHHTVAADLDDLLRVVRPANEPHLQGLTLLVELIRQGKPDQVHALVTSFHAWATPRLLAAAAISADGDWPSSMEGLR